MIGRLQDSQFYQLKSRFFVWIQVVIVTFEPRNFSYKLIFFGGKAGYFWADSRLSSAINSLAVSALRMQSACVTGDLNQDLAAALLRQR
jgi:hypothetical protein